MHSQERMSPFPTVGTVVEELRIVFPTDTPQSPSVLLTYSEATKKVCSEEHTFGVIFLVDLPARERG